MKKIKKWLKDKAAIASVAFANVEKNALGQSYESLGSDVNQLRRNTQGQLADSLKHGEVTQEVMDLRWRTYRVLKAVDGYVTEIIGYDDDGFPITRTKKIDKKKGLEKIKMDEYDSYPLEMMVINDEISLGGTEVMDRTPVKSEGEPVESKNDKGEKIMLHGNVESLMLNALNKAERPLIVSRNIFPKFKIESYAKKLNVRTIDDTKKLLEFYISKYPNEYDRKSYLLISEIKKAMVNPFAITLLEISEVEFITYKTLGSDDFMKYSYKIDSFDKIIEYDGHYVIKFNASVLVDGEDTLEKYRQVELDKKYENKERK
jgi:hypothetical protein